jgi:hypothetical protein
MNADRSHRPLHFLALGLAGVCLTVGSLEFLPWLPVGLVAYLLVLAAAHHYAGRAEMSEWLANLLGLIIGGGAAVWVMLGGGESWAADVPRLAALIPYIGPLLMVLLCVRLFRPRSPADFWLLQGLGLLQVVLGCVLATGTLFGLALLAYLAAAASAVAAYERHGWASKSGLVPDPDPLPASPGWLLPVLGWMLGTGLLGMGLFLLSPRLDQPAWDPLTHFGLQHRQPSVTRTGFSEEMDLNRAGDLVADDTAAFWLDVRGQGGEPRDLPSTTRFRGLVLTYYDQGRWSFDENSRRRISPDRWGNLLGQALASSAVGWVARGVSGEPWPAEMSLLAAATPYVGPALGPDFLVLRFRVPRRTGGLFVADPVHLSPTVPGALPIGQTAGGPDDGPMFYEANGTVGTALIGRGEDLVYAQFYTPDGVPEHTPLVRTADSYLRGLLRGPPPTMEQLARSLLLRLGPDDSQWLRELSASPINLSSGRWRQAAELLRDHLADSGEYRYSLSAKASRGGDPTMHFLTQSKEGPCQYYASSLVLLLRATGVPARVVKGYRWAEQTGPGQYVVRQSAAHAWAEVVVPAEDEAGYEWLTLDPTPPPPEAEPQSGLLKWWQDQGLGGQKFWRELIVNYNGDKQKAVIEQIAAGDYLDWVGRGLMLAVAVVAAFVAWRIYLRYRRHAQAGAVSLHRRMLRPLRRRGLVPEPGEAPREFAERAGKALPEPVAGIPLEVVALYYRVRFGGQAEDVAELKQIEGRVAELEALA